MSEAEMGRLYYAPGDTTLVAAPGWAVLVDVPATDALAGRLLEGLLSTTDVDEILEILVSPGLRTVKNFAVAQWAADGTRVVVRGNFIGAVQGGTDVVGSGLWTDRFIASPATVTLRSGGGDSANLPLGWGVVRAAAATQQADRPAEALALPRVADVESAAPEASEASETSDVPAPVVPAPVVPAPVVAAPDLPEVAELPSAARFAEPLAAAWQPEPVAFHDSGRAERDDPAPSVQPAAPGVLEPQPAADAPAAPADAGLLIEFFPWATSEEEAPWGPAPGAGGPSDEPQAQPVPAPPTPAFDPEAAEMTVDRRTLVGHSGPSDTLVVAARCPQGHLSPAYAGGCRVCGQPLPPQQPFETPRPPLGVLRLSNGDVVPLDRGLILGRNPRLPAGYAGDQPNLLKLNDPAKDISSQHLEVTLDFWHVLVKDLGSTNGTEVILPGEQPVQLRANDPMMIEPGTRVVLAGVVDFVFEVTG